MTTETRVLNLLKNQLVLNKVPKIDDNLQEMHNLDSLDTVEIMFAVEDEFNFEIKDNDMEQVKSPQDLVNLVTSYQNAP